MALCAVQRRVGVRPDKPTMPPPPTAIILGASGSVGRALLAEASKPGRFLKVIVIARRPLNVETPSGTPVVEHLVPDMDPQRLSQAVVQSLAPSDSNSAGPVVGFSALGVGAGTARMTIDEHRAVDVELNAAFAAGLRASGKVKHLVFMSAVGASLSAKATGSGAAGMPRYARVKGEAEQAVQARGPEIVSILRPSVIVGSQHTRPALATALSLIAPLLPTRYRPIQAVEIARAMVALALKSPSASSVYSFSEMRSLSGGAA